MAGDRDRDEKVQQSIAGGAQIAGGGLVGVGSVARKKAAAPRVFLR